MRDALRIAESSFQFDSDRRGVIRHVRFGEGGYADSEAWIERLLAEPAP